MSKVASGVEDNILGDEFNDKCLYPVARTYTSEGVVARGTPDSYSRKPGESKSTTTKTTRTGKESSTTTTTTTVTTTREIVEADFSQFTIPEHIEEKEPEEIVEEEPMEIQTRGKERWGAVRNLFMQKENPNERAEEMCGIYVTSLPAEGGGYSIKMANTNSLQRVVQVASKKRLTRAQTKASADFDFSASENLEIQDLNVPQIEVTGPLKCSVSLAPGEVVALKLLRINDAEDTSMAMSVAPGAKSETKELKSGLHLTTTTLSQCRGADYVFDNPTDNPATYEFDFTKSENLELLPSVNGAHETVAVSGMCATITVPAHSEDIQFVSLRTIDRDQKIKLFYSMSDAVKVTKETLKCGVELYTHPLPKRGGYMLQLISQVKDTIALQFDFSGCKNLAVKGGAETEVDNYKARCKIGGGQTVKPFVLLVVEQPNAGIIVNYTMTHTVVK